MARGESSSAVKFSAAPDEAPPVQEAPPKMDNPVNVATVPLDGPPTLAERRRTEEKVAKEKEELHDEYKAAISKLDLSKSKYKFNLYRTSPLSFRGIKTGAPQGMLIATYDEPFEVEDVMENHGGQDYFVSIIGPDPENPNKNRTRRARLNPIMAPPKTVSTAGGTMLLEDAPASTHKGDEGFSVAMLGMVKEMVADMRKEPAKAGPDPLVTMQMEQAKQAHELRMKQMDLDAAKATADANVEAARLKAESEKVKAEAEARVKEADLRYKADQAERDRAHASEMKRIQADSDRAVAAERQRSEDQKALRDMLDGITKASDAKMEKIVDKLASSKPVSIFKEVGDAMESMKKMGLIPTGEKEEEESPTAKLVQASLPEFFKLANNALERFVGGGGQPAPKQPAKQIQKPAEDVVAAAEIPNDARDVTPPAAAQETPAAVVEPDLPFEWPVDGDDDVRLGSKMGKNLGVAIEAKWDASRIFAEMVSKFPEAFQKNLVTWGLDMVFSGISQHAPEDSAIRSIGGRRVVRTVFKVLEKKFGGK